MRKAYNFLEEWGMYLDSPLNCKTEEEKRRNGMSIDFSIVIDYPVPKYLKNDLEALEECYEIGAWYAWDNIVSSLDGSTKIAKMENKIDGKQRIEILKKYNYF